MKKNTCIKWQRGLVFFFAVGFLANPFLVFARENVTDWYIKDFHTEIRVNKDSSLDITEKITADCGSVPGKHGIFRILPERINIEGQGKIKTPVELISITDFWDKPLKYSESRNYSDGTITWKIGEADKTVSGVNYYKIHYKVKNAIRFDNPDFDEFYWNLNGNFWDLETDKFQADIIFPAEVTKNNSQVEYYTGYLGSKEKNLANFQWSDDNVLTFNSTETLLEQQGITASVTFPKNIFTPYQAGFLETYGSYFFLLLPVVTFFTCFYLWYKYGKDPRIDRAIVPEYDAPGNLTPMELGMLMRNGAFDNKFVTAEIVNLATQKLITIKEIDDKIWVFHSRDYELTKNSNPQAEGKLNSAQRELFSKIFEEGNKIKLSSLKNKFYKHVKDIESKAEKILEEKGLIAVSGLRLRTALVLMGIGLIVLSFFLGNFSVYLAVSLFFSGLIMFVFSFVMPKRTLAGANLNWEVKGFRMFMETAEKYRAEFYEKENIFEKFLPYAIVFEITKIWIEKMKEIYGEDFYTHYAPVWYAGNASAFDVDSFSSTIDSLSSSIAASTSSPSGSGGSGGSGGGGGGGGGGGW